MSKSAVPFDAEPRISELAERAVAALRLANDEPKAALKANLARLAKDFWGNRLLQSVSGQPGEQRLLLQQLAATLRKAETLMLQIAPEYAVAISVDGDARSMSLHDLGAELRRRANRIEHFDRAFRPSHGSADFALDDAVRALMATFEAAGLEKPKVRQGRQDVEPSFLSNESVAMGIVLQGIDPQLSTRTLVNKISEIAKGQKPVASHLDAIVSVCSDDLQECLLPSRNKTRK
ncbi:hypothetical protein [Sphingomonas flavescens]|uniref:hypothetical protein n=1 Tax=Sphingomonas flavescens TaxID=3132797 RepID=UPI0028054CF7|nr:hypothetical protein [Sphingomonas limnosediminicola]